MKSPHFDQAIFGGYRPDGLYIFGPASIRCVLAVFIAETIGLIAGSTPEAERIEMIRKRATYMQSKYSRDELEDMEAERRTPKLARIGSFYAPRKPATSGRKRKAA